MKTKKIILDLLLCVLKDLLKQYKQTSLDLLKIEALIYYIKGIKIVRFIYLGIFLLLLSFVFMINGFLLVHVAFFYYVPWSRDVKLLTIFSLGICYFLIPLGMFIYFASQRMWMKLSKADEFIHKVLKKNSEKK